MKKKHWGILCIIIAIVICIFACVIGAKIASIQSALKNWDEKRLKDKNDSYVEYVCKDYHLVCLDAGERVGNYYITVDTHEYSFKYQVIENVSEEQFIVAWVRWNAPFALGESLVLQSPENSIDVLSEWTIDKITLYYYDDSDDSNPGIRDMSTAEDYVTYEIAVSDEPDLIEELKAMQLNREPAKDALADIQEEPDVYYVNNQSYAEAMEEYIQFKLRVYFKETASIAWDTEITILQAEDDESRFVITVDSGTMDAELEHQSGDIIVDSSGKLYQFILDAYENAKLGEYY